MYKRDDECPGKETFSYKCTQQFYLRMYISTYIIAYQQSTKLIEHIVFIVLSKKTEAANKTSIELVIPFSRSVYLSSIIGNVQ